MTIQDPTRRTVLAAATMWSVAAGTNACAQPNSEKPQIDSKMLVAYVTRSGNTRVIAGTLSRTLGTDLFEIRSARPYPDDYEATVEQARQERDRGAEPLLADKISNITVYDVVFLGFPIWGETAPPLIRSFLRAHSLSGKTVRPFITHGGYGPGNSLSVLTSHAPDARIGQPFVLECDQERRTIDQVKGWLGES